MEEKINNPESKIEEGSALDAATRKGRAADPVPLEEENFKNYPKQFQTPQIDYGTYKRKHSFEVLVYNLADDGIKEVHKFLTEAHRTEFKAKIKEPFKCQLDYFKFYDEMYQSVEDTFERKKFESSLSFEIYAKAVGTAVERTLLETLKWLSLNNRITVMPTEADQKQFATKLYHQLVQHNSDKFTQDAEKNKMERLQLLSITAVIAQEYYDNHIKNLPITLN